MMRETSRLIVIPHPQDPATEEVSHRKRQPAEKMFTAQQQPTDPHRKLSQLKYS
jgi:hypothetical protein